MGARKKLIAGNWKMNGLKASLAEIARVGEAAASASVDLAVCPPATLASRAIEAAGPNLAVGGQDCHWEASGAFTGDISARMWADLGARYVIVGHSERRADHAETDAVVARKADAVLAAGLIPIICIGETLAERDGGQTLDVVRRQLAASVPETVVGKTFVVAYEPIWAIGTGRTPTIEQVAEVHGAIREALRARLGSQAEAVRLLYGGSVKPDNARALMATQDVDGALVGGASLKASDFLAIAACCG